MRLRGVDAVGLPGLAACAAGLFLFFVALLLARKRKARLPVTDEAARASRSMWWVGVQALAFVAVGYGPVAVTLDPLSPVALAEGALVAVLMLSAVALFDRASRAMGANWSIVARTRSDHLLVEHGPFAVVRHPIYVALFLLLLAIAIAYGHGRSLVVGIPLYVLGTWFRVRHEERLLRDRFGAAYDGYAIRVRRFVPGLF